MLTTWQKEKLEHPVFDVLKHPEAFTLAVTSDPFPDAFNYFAEDGVVIKAVSAARGTCNMSGKGTMARRAFQKAIEEEFLRPGMRAIEASSGNTGPEMLGVAMQIDVPFTLLLSNSMPPPKLERARALTDGNLRRLFGNAKLAREMAEADENLYNFDQYSGDPNGFNAWTQGHILAPQVFTGNEDAAAIFVVGGSWGTALGLDWYTKNHGLRTKVVAVVAAARQDISGGKNMGQTKNDILRSVLDIFPEDTILRCPRDQATLLSWLSWPYVVSASRGVQFNFGQSFGATYRGAIEWVLARKADGTLDSYRNAEGQVVLLTFGMDDFQGYTNIYLSELPDWVLEGPRKLLPLEELMQFGRVA